MSTLDETLEEIDKLCGELYQLIELLNNTTQGDDKSDLGGVSSNEVENSWE